jgi:hypothetical protein
VSLTPEEYAERELLWNLRVRTPIQETESYEVRKLTWRDIETARVREGFTDARSFIVAKIKAYLTMLKATPSDTGADVAGVPGITAPVKYPTAADERRFGTVLNEEPEEGNGTDGN